MLMIDGNGTPLSVFTLSANQAEVNALENLVDIRVTKKKPKRMLYDKAAVQSRTHDHARWSGYRRRFNLSWRLVVRYEYHDYLFQGFVQLGCLFTILKGF